MTTESPTPRNQNWKKPAYVLAILVAIGVIAFGAYSYLNHRYRTIVADFSESLKPNWGLQYADLRVSPFLGKVTLVQPSLSYKGSMLARADAAELGGLQGSDNQLAHAKVTLNNLQFSASGQDLTNVSGPAPQTVVVTGNGSFDYSHDTGDNSYRVENFNFQSIDHKNDLSFSDMQLNNFVQAEDGRAQSFGFKLANAAYSKYNPELAAKTGADGMQSTRFSTEFGFERTANNNGYVIRQFNLALPDINEHVSFDLASLQTQYQGDVPVSFVSEVKNLDVPIAADSTMSDFWKPYGYTRFKSDMRTTYAYNMETKKTATTLSLRMPEMLTLNLAFDLSGILVEEMIKTPGTPFPYDTVKLDAAKIDYTDASFLKKTIQINASRNGVSEADYITQLSAQIDREFVPDPANADPAMVDAANKIKAYLTTLGTVNIALTPQEPVGLAQFAAGLLMDRNKLFRLLGLSVSVS